MPDIIMCQGAGEQLCERCYRKTATPDGDHQSWFAAPQWKNGDCPYFIEMPPTLTARDQIDVIAYMFSNTTRIDHE